jgi:hypothetical protein
MRIAFYEAVAPISGSTIESWRVGTIQGDIIESQAILIPSRIDLILACGPSPGNECHHRIDLQADSGEGRGYGGRAASNRG